MIPDKVQTAFEFLVLPNNELFNTKPPVVVFDILELEKIKNGPAEVTLSTIVTVNLVEFIKVVVAPSTVINTVSLIAITSVVVKVNVGEILVDGYIIDKLLVTVKLFAFGPITLQGVELSIKLPFPSSVATFIYVVDKLVGKLNT